MIFNIEKAVERFAWRIKEGHFKCNENDIKAYNTIVDFVKDKQHDQIQSQELFAKLYIHVYGQFLLHYNSDVFNQEPKKQLNRIISKDLSTIIVEFYEKVNQIKVDRDLLKCKTTQDFSEVKIQQFSKQYIEDNIIKQLNEVISKYK